MIEDPGHAIWYFLTHSSIAFFCAVEPEAVIDPVAQEIAPVAVPAVELGAAVSSEPQAATPSTADIARPMTAT